MPQVADEQRFTKSMRSNRYTGEVQGFLEKVADMAGVYPDEERKRWIVTRMIEWREASDRRNG